MRLTRKQLQRRSLVVDAMRWLCSASPYLQELWFGADYKRAVDVLRYLVFRHDCQAAICADPLMLPAHKSDVVALLPPPRSEDEALADVAPPWELLVAMQVQYGQYDVDALSPDDFCEIAEEMDWCRFWLDWYSRNAC